MTKLYIPFFPPFFSFLRPLRIFLTWARGADQNKEKKGLPARCSVSLFFLFSIFVPPHLAVLEREMGWLVGSHFPPPSFFLPPPVPPVKNIRARMTLYSFFFFSPSQTFFHSFSARVRVGGRKRYGKVLTSPLSFSPFSFPSVVFSSVRHTVDRKGERKGDEDYFSLFPSSPPLPGASLLH